MPVACGLTMIAANDALQQVSEALGRGSAAGRRIARQPEDRETPTGRHAQARSVGVGTMRRLPLPQADGQATIAVDRRRSRGQALAGEHPVEVRGGPPTISLQVLNRGGFDGRARLAGSAPGAPCSLIPTGMTIRP